MRKTARKPAKKVMVALTLLKTSTSIAERAELFVIPIKRNIQRDVLDKLQEQKEKWESRLLELKEFNLETNLNSGLKALSQTECEQRFKEMINIEFELELLQAEIDTKTASFNKYFGD